MSNKLTVNYIISEENITLNYDGQTHTVSQSSNVASEILEALTNEDYDLIPNLVDKSKAVSEYSDNNFSVVNGIVMIGNFEVPEVLSNKILSFMEKKLPYQPLINFANNLLKNPSRTSLLSLYRFLDHNNHPITPDGCFIAYKRVRHDFKDIYSGTFDNSPGQKVSVARNQVDEDVNNTCSKGLHVANWEYAHLHYSQATDDVLVEVKVNPANVVAVPSDYNNSKMRVCEYEVLGVVKNPHDNTELLRKSARTMSADYLDKDYGDEDEEAVAECCGFCYKDDLCNDCYNSNDCLCIDEDEDEDEDEENY